MPREKEAGAFLVLGMGNPLLRDGSFGLKVVEEAEKAFTAGHMHATFKRNCSGGIDLLYDMVGYDKAIIIDSLVTGKAPAGYCHEFSLATIDDAVQEHYIFAHGISMETIFRIGKRCGYPMPAETVILAVESCERG